MIRRRVFAYAIMFASGIISGYVFFEMNSYIYGMAIMLSLGLSLIVIDLEYIPEKNEKEKIIIFTCLLIGFMVFTFSFIKMNRPFTDAEGHKISVEKISSVSGTVTDEQYKNGKMILTLRPTSIHGASKMQLSVYEYDEPEKYSYIGCGITAFGGARLPAGCDNPGCFNYRAYMYSRGFRLTFSAEYIRIDENGISFLAGLRKRMRLLKDEFACYFKEETSAFLKGVIFGDKSEIDKETLEEFNTNSTGHILAVSGLHVGFLYLLLRICTRKRKTLGVSVFIWIVIILYGEMTGWSPSTSRAVLVLIINMLALYCRRSPDMLCSVCASAIIMLFANPYQIINTGFQMSYLALLGICFLIEPLSYYVGETFAVMLAIQVSVAPMIAYTYSSFNIFSMFINLPVVFLASILVPVSIIGLMILLICGSIPEIVINLINNLTGFILDLNRLLSFDGSFVATVKGFDPGILVLFYSMLFFISSEWVRVKLIRKEHQLVRRMIPFILIPSLCLCLCCQNVFLDDDVVFVSVGQGDACHIREGDADILIDGGGNKFYNVGEQILEPYLTKNGADNLEMALATHLHMDHFQGIIELDKVFPVGSIGIPMMCRNSVTDENNAEYCYLDISSRISLDEETYIEPIWPLDGRAISDTDNENEANMVYIIHCGSFKIMITGDLLEEDENDMLKYYGNTDTLKCDVLKVGHHGSKSSSSEAFLDAVDPDIAVISVGLNNTYGHPHEQTLERLRDRGIRIYRTDLNGAIGLEFRKNRIHVDVMR